MKFKIFFAVFLNATSVFCLNSITTQYCMADDDQYGIIITEKEGKFGHLAGIYSDYLDNTTTILSLFNFTEPDYWKIWRTTERDSPLNRPVFDKRWETIKNNYNGSSNFENIFARDLSQPVFFSVMTNDDISNLQKSQWHHLMLQNKTLRTCAGENFNECSSPISDQPRNFFLKKTRGALWKLHEYDYFFTDARNVTEIMYENSKNCDVITNGCLTIYFAACNKCHVLLNLTARSGIRTQNITGTGSWHTEKISLDNFTKCFTLDVTTQTDGDDKESNSKLFWAFGDIGYISTNQTCDKNKRYIASNFPQIRESVVCQNSLGKKIDFLNVSFGIKEQPFKHSSFNLLYVLIMISGMLSLGLVVYLYAHKRNKRVKTNYEHKIVLDEVPESTALVSSTVSKWLPLQVSDFIAYVGDLLNQNDEENNIQRQFASLPKGYLKDYTHATKRENIAKNRFPNVLPYDDNRVILKKKVAKNFFTGDYINASYVQGASNYKEYIIAQSPLKNTLNDFWIMIWQKNINNIVMITNEEENYHYYWPQQKGHHITCGDIEIYLDEISYYQYYEEKKFLVTRDGNTKELFQLHYYNWQDNDIIASSKNILPFIDHLLKIPHYSSPVLFHSQDDTDPSGVVVLCDIVLRSLPILPSVDVYSTAKMLRHSRVNTIATLEQYKLAYLILKQFLEKYT